MNRILILVISVVLVLSAGIIAQKTPTEIKINEGKNNLTINFGMEKMYVSDFVKNYPEIETMTWKDPINESNRKGFVNIFGGVGEDFVLETNQTYEIVSKENITVVIG